jgi:uncharacterized protein YhbP (UPF0306 family)
VSDGTRAKVEGYLAGHAVMTLATRGARGPWAAAVFYAHEGTRFYFLSSPTSRHCTDLAADPRAAAAIHEDHRDWRDIKGVQLEGTVAEVDPREVPRVRALYGAKFPVIGAGAPAAIAAALARIRWYALTAEALHFIDNSVAFGHRTRVI